MDVNNTYHNELVIWKDVVLAFSLIGNWSVWKVGLGNKVTVGEDPWVGCDGRHRLPRKMVEGLREHVCF